MEGTTCETLCAASYALSIPELLESVLLSLPPLALFPVQRVCRAWNDTIRTSPALQRHMFLRADTNLRGHLANDRPGPRPRNNLALCKVLGGQHPSMTLLLCEFPSRQACDSAKRERLLGQGDRDTLESALEDNTAGPDGEQLGFWAWNVNVSFPARPGDVPESDAVAYEHASWRRLLVSQPPPTALYLTKRWRRSAEPTIEVPEGIKMQDLLDAAAWCKDESDDEPDGNMQEMQDTRRPWNDAYIGSDGDWHLEGPIKYSHFVEWRADGSSGVRHYRF